jgi:Ca2+-binding EF-hand superfamily protein
MMDRDRNGKVSKSEFSQYMSQTFHRRDLNKNGQLERNELSPTLLRRMDRDRNGAVSKTEYMQHMSQTFHRLDVNKNGQLEPEELQRLPSSYSCSRSGTC